MKRKIFALLLCMVFICTLSLPVYADSTTTSSDGYSVLISDIPTTCPTCSGSLSASWASTSGAEVEVQISDSGSIKIPAGAGSFAYIQLRCKSCGYEKSETRLLGLDFGNEKPGNLHVEKAPSGIGRKDLPGYESSDNNPGVPSISQDGNIALLAKYRFTNNQKQLVDSFSKQVDNDIWNFGENSLYIERYSKNSSRCYTYCGYILDTHNVPGIYYVPAGTSYVFNPWGDGNVRNLNGKEWPENTSLYVGSSSSDGSKRYLCIYRYNADKTYDSYRYPEMRWSIGDGTDDIFRQDSGYSISTSGNITIPYPKDLVVYLRPTSTNIVKNTNVTINNNDYSQTWNGNIYTDNSTNLTYIYPQYTTINEKNETVTNISTNPIIYNNETKQYYTYDSVTNNYYYITYETTPTPTPSPSPAPAPTWTPGGGATRGGGVGRHPSDTDAADWTLHYYVLNNRRYDAYYALKKTEVDTDTKLPWVDNKKYISTTQIPIANGQYTVSVPDGVYWRVWSWDEASQTLTGVNSSNWHSTINNFLFNATGEYIFEFCKADGSDFNTAKDVTLKLKNDKITDYEDGGTIVEEPTPSPSPEPTETPSPTEPPIPTATPTPGGGTVPTPGGDSGGGNSGSSDSGWNPFKWLTDLLKDIVETILKGLWKLLTSIFGFILWLLSLLFKLFPWMPNSGILALCAGVVVVTVIRIIKFITGR